MLAVSLSLLRILSFSVKVILLVDKTLSGGSGVTAFQNFLLSVMFPHKDRCTSSFLFFPTKRHNNFVVSNTLY